MPVRSFIELGNNGVRHVGLTSDASEHTRYIRMAATIAPYIRNGVSPVPKPSGGGTRVRTAMLVSLRPSTA